MNVSSSHIIAVVAVLVSVGGLAYLSANTIDERDVVDIVEENIPVVDIPQYVQCHKDVDCVGWVNANYISEGELSINNSTINKRFSEIEKEFSSMRLELAKVSAVQEKLKNTSTTSNTSDSSCRASTMDLKVSSSDPSDIRVNFDRGEIVYITGKSESSTGHLIKIINNNTDEVIEETSFNTFSDGAITRVFISDGSDLKGRYTVQIERGFEKSCIGFALE